MPDILKKLRISTLGAAIRMGGFIGWYLTVMYICDQSLRFYRDNTMLSTVNIIFMLSLVIAAAVLTAVLLLLDIEGLLSDKILRWLPGVFMAESGIALSLANASTMTVFASVAGVASAFGALAIMSQLLRVKVGQRMASISIGLALGGLIRLISILLIGSNATKTGLMIAAIAIGVIAALTVHSEGYSTSEGGLIVSLAEAEPRTILRKIPISYISLFIISTAFYFAHSHIEAFAVNRITEFNTTYSVVASLGFMTAALIAAVLVRLPMIPMVFVFGSGLSAAAAMLAGLPYMTSVEASCFAFISYAALVCVKASFFMMIVTFSLDRPHPIFYAFLGYGIASCGQLAGLFLDRFLTHSSLPFYVIILLLLMPVGGGLIAGGMSKYGFTQAKFDHRHNIKAAISRSCSELELSQREQYMVESIVLDNCEVEDLASKMLFSRNTVKVLLRSLLPKFKTENLDSLREHFDKMATNDEKFMADVQAAEADRRAAEKIEHNQHRKEERELRREQKAEKKAAEERELSEKAAQLQMMEIILGGDSGDSDFAEDDGFSEDDGLDVPEGDETETLSDENTEDEVTESDTESDESESDYADGDESENNN